MKINELSYKMKNKFRILLFLGLMYFSTNVEAQTSCLINNGVTATITGTHTTPYIIADGSCTTSSYTGTGYWAGVINGVLTYTFSQPVISATVTYTAVNTNDIGFVKIDGGGLMTLSSPCGLIPAGCTVSKDNTTFPSAWIDTKLTVSSTVPFTTITMHNINTTTGFVQGNPCDFTVMLVSCDSAVAMPTLN